MRGFGVIHVLVIGAGFVFAWFSRQAESRREAERRAVLQSVADEHGLQFLPDAIGPEGWPPTFHRGHSGKISKQLVRPDGVSRVCHFRYVTGSGKSRREHEATAALVGLPFQAHWTTVSGEGIMRGVLRAVGLGDVEVESPEFNERFRLTGDDERFTVALFDQATIAWFLDHRVELEGVELEFTGNVLTMMSPAQPLPAYPSLLAFAEELVAALPAVLPSLYPAER